MTTEIKGGLLAQGSDPEVLRVLCGARDRLRRGWTTEAPARTAAGAMVATASPEAVAWCMCGAMGAGLTPGDHLYNDAYSFVRLAIRELEPTAKTIVDWNDAKGRTQAEVLAAFDRAIALAEGNAPQAPPSPSSPALDPQETK